MKMRVRSRNREKVREKTTSKNHSYRKQSPARPFQRRAASGRPCWPQHRLRQESMALIARSRTSEGSHPSPPCDRAPRWSSDRRDRRGNLEAAASESAGALEGREDEMCGTAVGGGIVAERELLGGGGGGEE